MTSMIYNPDFKVMIIQCQVTRKWYNIELCLQWPTNRKSYMIYRTAPLSLTLNDSYSWFQGHVIFNAENLRNGTTYRQFHWNTNRDLHTPYSTVSFRMSDLAKYSMTRSVELSFLHNQNFKKMFVLCVISYRVQSLRTLKTLRHCRVVRFTPRDTSGQKCGYVYKNNMPYARFRIYHARCRSDVV